MTFDYRYMKALRYYRMSNLQITFLTRFLSPVLLKASVYAMSSVL